MHASKLWDQKDFAKRMRIAFHIRKIKQVQLAAALRVAPGTVSRWMSSTAHYPGLDHLLAAARFLKVEPCWLVFGCESHVPPEYTEMENAEAYARPTMRRKAFSILPSRRFH
jgi:transcriptional regulator with XRE-family HTH domain